MNDIDAMSDSIIRNIKSLDVYKIATKQLLFHSYNSEFRCEKLISKEKINYFPKVSGETMDFYEVYSLKDFEEGYKGIKEPKTNLNKYSNIGKDIVFLPGLAFSKEGYRLGYGKGFYDKYLKEMNLIKIGLCFDFQLIDKVPYDKFDISLDLIVTDRNVYSIKGEL